MEQYDDTLLLSGLSKLGLTPSKEQLDMLHTFFYEMVETNKVMNLTGITEYQDVVVKHFIDSLCVVLAKEDSEAVRRLLAGESVSVIDVGTGAGFPGMPMAIMFPNMKIALMDSLNKRIGFLSRVVDMLGLTNVTCIHGRAEELGIKASYREQYDLCVSRAVARLASLSEWCIPFVKVNGCFLPLKAGDSEEEITEALNAVKALGCTHVKNIVYQVPESDYNRVIPVILKKQNTSSKYPRGGGKPLKQPL